MKKKKIAPFLSASLVALLLAPPARPADPPSDKSAASRFIVDAGITAEIKARQARDRFVSSVPLFIETRDGIVELSGVTPSMAQKFRAEEIARTVPGVKDVSNDILVPR